MFIDGSTRPERKASVMVVDNRELFRDSIKLLLESGDEFEVVAGASDIDGAIRYARGHRPDLAVIGPFMIDPLLGDHADHEEVIRSIREASDGTRILLVAARRDVRRLAAALDAGATGIVEMTAPAEELLTAARRLVLGDAHMPPAIALEMVKMSRVDADDGLTNREEDMLGEIALGFTNHEIADHMHLSVRTVESHRARIQDKLGVTSRAGLVRQALDRGLVY